MSDALNQDRDRHTADNLRLTEENAGHAHAWPIRPTRCGEHPGLYGDVEPTRLNPLR